MTKWHDDGVRCSKNDIQQQPTRTGSNAKWAGPILLSFFNFAVRNWISYQPDQRIPPTDIWLGALPMQRGAGTSTADQPAATERWLMSESLYMCVEQ